MIHKANPKKFRVHTQLHLVFRVRFSDVCYIFQTFDSMEVPENLTAAMIDMGTKFQETVLEDKENSQPKNEATSNKPMRFMLSGVTDEEKSRFVLPLNLLVVIDRPFLMVH
jgi:hypothetical protein